MLVALGVSQRSAAHVGQNSTQVPTTSRDLAQVYRGRKRFTGQMAALKFINKKGKSAKEVTTLRQEMTILSTLEHDNIIRWLDNFETDTDFIVVTELAQGACPVMLPMSDLPVHKK